MVALLIILGAASLVGIAVLAVSVEKAPEGYQSSKGFHYGPKEDLDTRVRLSQTAYRSRADIDQRIAARSNTDQSSGTSVFTRSS